MSPGQAAGGCSLFRPAGCLRAVEAPGCAGSLAGPPGCEPTPRLAQGVDVEQSALDVSPPPGVPRNQVVWPELTRLKTERPPGACLSPEGLTQMAPSRPLGGARSFLYPRPTSPHFPPHALWGLPEDGACYPQGRWGVKGNVECIGPFFLLGYPRGRPTVMPPGCPRYRDEDKLRSGFERRSLSGGTGSGPPPPKVDPPPEFFGKSDHS